MSETHWTSRHDHPSSYLILILAEQQHAITLVPGYPTTLRPIPSASVEPNQETRCDPERHDTVPEW